MREQGLVFGPVHTLDMTKRSKPKSQHDRPVQWDHIPGMKSEIFKLR